MYAHCIGVPATASTSIVIESSVVINAQSSALTPNTLSLVVVILGFVVNILVPFLFMSNVVVPLPATSHRASNQYTFAGHPANSLLVTFVAVAPIVPAKTNIECFAFSSPYFISVNPDASVSQMIVTVTVLDE
jgi:hypothetical protein